MKLLLGFVGTAVPSRLRWLLVILIHFCNVNAVWHENRCALNRIWKHQGVLFALGDLHIAHKYLQSKAHVGAKMMLKRAQTVDKLNPLSNSEDDGKHQNN